MKKYIFFTLLLFSITIAFAQQTMSDSVMVRKYGHLQFENSKEKLNDSVVQYLLTADDFTIYQYARKKYKNAVPLWVMTGVGLGVATSLHLYGLVAWLASKDSPFSFFVGYMIFGLGFAGVAVVGTLGFFIPAIILTKDCNKKLGEIVDNYNQRNNPVSLKFGFNSLGVGLTLNF